VTYTDLLSQAHAELVELYAKQDKVLPRNLGSDRDLKRRELDCLVINFCIDKTEKEAGRSLYSSVRSAFAEGVPAYAGAMISKESHIQIAVRKDDCIVGLLRPIL